MSGRKIWIDLKRPVDLYPLLKRLVPAVAPDLIYPGHFDKRLVIRKGGIRWDAGQRVGLEGTVDGVWDIFPGHVKSGRFIEEQ